MTAWFQNLKWDNLIQTVLIILVVFVLWKVVSGIFRKKVLENDKNRDSRTLSFILYDILKYVLMVLTILTVLEINGVNVTSFVAGLGIAGAAIGLAVQDIIKDILMGIHIVTDRFFKVGDPVRYEGRPGIIVSFNMRTTKIKMLDTGDILSVCNRNIIEIATADRWHDIDLMLSYETAYEEIDAACMEVCEGIRALSGIEKCEYKGVDDFQDSAVKYKIRIWCAPDKFYDLRRSSLRIVQTVFRDRGIVFPYPQLDVHNS